MMLSEKQTAQRARRRPIGLILLAAFIVVPLAEIAVLIKVGGWLGLGPTLALIVLTAVIGTWMLRRQGFAVLRRAQQQIQNGAMPISEVFEGVCLVIAGALLLTPGFLTDATGALLLAPPVRTLLYRRLRSRIEAEVRPSAPPPDGGRGTRTPQDKPPVVDVDFQDVDPEDMPEPRGSWRRHP